MQRYFSTLKLAVGAEVVMSADDSHHILTVMRMSEGAEIEVVDADASLFIAEITDVSKTVVVTIVQRIELNTELPVETTIIIPLLKGDKLDWLLQKATELGAHDFHIYEAERAVVKLDDKKRKKRTERFVKIVKEAAEQSKRLRIPKIKFVGKLSSLDSGEYGNLMVAYEGAALDESKHLSHALTPGVTKVGCIFGPEGGFSSSELESLNNAMTIRLGPRILRAETAPLYFLSAVSFKYEA